MNRFRPSVLRNEFSHAARDDEDSPSGADGNKPPGEYGQGHGQEATLAEPAGEFCIGDHPRGSAKAFLLPLHYETNYDYPLLVWLHSDGYNEHQVEHVMPHISLRNYVGLGVRGVRAADAAGHRFDWPSGLTATDAAHEAVAQAVRQARERFSINSRRVVVAGYGSGGTMGLRIAMRDPHSFAGVVSLGGYLPDRGRPFSDLQTLRRRRLPMLWGWGQANRRYDSERLARDIRAAMMMKAIVDIRQYDDDDEMNTVTLADVNQWIIDRVVSGSDFSSDRWNSTETHFSSN